ncbi:MULTISPECIES: DUF1127 domain-containing protein [unclassified Ensifer]|uniref:DUF1127 domain-containing protein n=1 Tax=unclassified Ensifer TaxID=2633371 RepID=UPI0008130DEA|nr:MULTISPECIES: DUF1127 domain-containing protein [unclassified Ensifer]OCP19067.1 hypothetical protein BC363_07430 [Ensifer sp. LC384]OCP28104.1 hypothetical protein BC361_00910 [Ensifer sp. LC54]OCP37625.1 hypothetical protein BC360_22315 [Ensifer sp. LC163]
MSTIDTICSTVVEKAPRARRKVGFDVEFSGRAKNALQRLWRLYCFLAAKRRSRLALEEMSDWQLRDIGVCEKDARRESSVPFWR